MSIAEKKDDAIAERGLLDAAFGRLTHERTVTRDGAPIERDTYEYILTQDGVTALAVWGDLYNFQGEERNQTRAAFLRITRGGFEFLTASAWMGAGFPPVSLGGEMTPDEAAQALEEAGFSVQARGEVADGALVIH